MLLKMRLDQNLDLGRKFQDELKQRTEEKEIAQFFNDCGGEKLVQPYLQLVQWWDSLSQDWQQKILKAPFRFVDEKLWFKLSQLNLEQLEQWYEDINGRSQESFHKNGSEFLTPNIWKKVTSQILPSPKRTKRFLKLHQTVPQEEFEVLLNQKDYNFTADSLEKFKLEVFAGVNGEIVTESLFPYLKAENLDPLLLLSPRDRERYEWEQKLKEKDKENEEMRSQFQQKLEQRDQRIAELEQRDQQKQAQITQQQTKIDQLTQQNHTQQTEINELKEQMKELMKRLQPA